MLLVVCIAVAVAVFATATNLNNSTKRVKINKTFGNNCDIGINLTYMNKIENFDNIFSIIAKGRKVEDKTKSDVRITTGFADTNALDNYIKLRGYNSNQEFLSENGYVSLYYQIKDKKYYLLQNKNTHPYSWNLLIENNGNFEFIKLSDITNDDNSKIPNLSFSKKVEYVDGKIRFYLDNGIYIVDINNKVEHKKINLNEIFYNISKKYALTLYSTKIEYNDDHFFIIAKDKKNKSYLINYDINKNTSTILPLNYDAQEITVVQKEIKVISVERNNIYLEEYNINENTITINKLYSGERFSSESFIHDLHCSVISYNNKLALSLSSECSKSGVNTYVFCFDIDNQYKLQSYNDYLMSDDNFMLYGIQMYIY